MRKEEERGKRKEKEKKEKKERKKGKIYIYTQKYEVNINLFVFAFSFQHEWFCLLQNRTIISRPLLPTPSHKVGLKSEMMKKDRERSWIDYHIRSRCKDKQNEQNDKKNKIVGCKKTNET